MRSAKWDHADRDERAGERDHRSQRYKAAGKRRGGHHIFFQEELDAIGQWLQQAEGADARRSPAILDASDNLALQKHGIGDARSAEITVTTATFSRLSRTKIRSIHVYTLMFPVVHM